jgi:hypothetical protein
MLFLLTSKEPQPFTKCSRQAHVFNGQPGAQGGSALCQTPAIRGENVPDHLELAHGLVKNRSSSRSTPVPESRKCWNTEFRNSLGCTVAHSGCPRQNRSQQHISRGNSSRRSAASSVFGRVKTQRLRSPGLPANVRRLSGKQQWVASIA